jgi:predicted TIM-barrel fold metal-dependent hydrolase
MIIDAHTHLWERAMIPTEAVRAYLEPLKNVESHFELDFEDDYIFPDFSIRPETLMGTMKAAGIDLSVVLPVDLGLVGETRMGIEEFLNWLNEICMPYDELIPFIGVDPNRGDFAIDLMERMVKKWGSKGVKLYPATGFYPNDERLRRFWMAVDDLDLVVLSHAGMAMGPLNEEFCHPLYFMDIASRHPDTRFIIAHLGGKFMEETFELMGECDNVYTDCSALQGWLPKQPEVVLAKMKQAADLFPDRLVFGSDFPYFEIRYPTSLYLEMLKKGDWATERVKMKVFGGTMARVLGI